MADFCLDCWNELNEINDPKIKYIISKDYTLCEGCGEFKQVIIEERISYYVYYRLIYITFPFLLIYAITLRLIYIIQQLWKKKKR